jgi:hypothetical protein
MRIICEVCKQEGYLQQLGNYFRVRHYQGKAETGKGKFFYPSANKGLGRDSIKEQRFYH